MTTPVILVHPLWFGGDYWEPVAAQLTPHMQVSTPDLPGFGQAPGPFTAASAKAVILTTQERLGEPVDLVGLSLGARVALAVAAENPNRVRSLMLLGIGADVSVWQAKLQSAALRVAGRGVARRLGGSETLAPSRAAVLAQPELPILSNAARISRPTRVVIGGADSQFRASCERVAAAITSSSTRMVADAEHFWPRDRPQDFIDVLTEWRHESKF